jgi:hypothetical protein
METNEMAVPTLSKCLGCGEEHLNYLPHRCGVCPGPCSVCEGSSHHWMELQDEDNDEIFYWGCKHCPQRVLYGESHPAGCDCPDHEPTPTAGGH